MPKLALGIDSLDAVPEGLREFYVQSDSDQKYYPDLDVEQLPTVRGLASTLQKFKEVAPDASKLAGRMARLKSFEDTVGEPEKFTELQQRLADGAPDAAALETLQRQHQQKVEELERNAQARVNSAQEEARRAQEAAENYYVSSVVDSAIRELDGAPHMLAHEVRRHVKAVLDPDTRSFSHEVLSASGGRWVKDGAGNYGTLTELVGKLFKEDPKWAGAFTTTPVTGSGQPPHRPGGGVKTVSAGDMTAFGANLEDIAKGTVQVV